MEGVVRRGDLQQVQALIRSGVEVHEGCTWGGECSLLRIAIEIGHQDIAIALLEAGADVHQENSDGQTALHLACANKGMKRVVKALIGRGSRVNRRDKFDRTPLMLAVQRGDEAVSNFLLRAGATYEGLLRDPINGTLHDACHKGNELFVKGFVAAGGWSVDSVGVNGYPPLMVATRNGHEKVALALLKGGANIHVKDECGQTVLHWACINGLEEVVQALVNRGIRVNEPDGFGRTPLLLSAPQGNTAISLHLLQAGASCKGLLKDQMNDMFHHACREGCLLVVHVLFKNGCGVSILSRREQKALLHYACHEGDELIVDRLITSGCSVNDVGTDGYPPLMVAARKGHQNVAIALLKAGVNIYIKDKVGQAALHWACINGLEEVAQVLIKQGSPMNQRNTCGHTPLMLAGLANTAVSMCLLQAGASYKGLSEEELNGLFDHAYQKGHIPAIQTLLQDDHIRAKAEQEHLLHHACHKSNALVEIFTASGCNLNCLDADGLTPLMVAVYAGQAEVVKTLILAGANVGVQDANGYTAFHFAAMYNHIQCGIVLAEGGASVRTKNKFGDTPLSIAEPEFKEAIEQALSFTIRKTLCIIGNAESGKSTLIAALQAESTGLLGRIFNRFRRVDDRRKRTAGIETIPHYSQRYGEVLFFDFAGQHEYHGPHQMFLESFLNKPGTSVTLLLVVKATDEEEAIQHQLHRWLSPVALMSTTASCPQVLVIGSFMDKVRSKEEATAKLTRCISATKKDLEELPITFAGSCFLNCRQPQSQGIDQLCGYLQDIPIPEFGATHSQYSLAWVLSQIRLSLNSPAVQLSEFSAWTQDNRNNLPWTMPQPEEVCKGLSAAGHALYLPNKEDSSKSWLVLDLPSILHNVYGTLFSKSKALCIVNEFGLLHCHRLADFFQHVHVDLEMVQQLLISLEFCIPVDPSVLKVEMSELTQSEEASGWLFFPALISAKSLQPTSEVLPQQSAHYLCWQLKTSKKHYISAYVLQTILLRLAAHFVVKQHDEEGIQQHCCTIWWNGIAWQSKKGIGVTVCITNNRVIQVVSTSKTLAERSCHYLTEVISDILSIVRQLSPKLAAAAYIVHPPKMAALCEDATAPSPWELFPVKGIRNSVRDHEEYSLSLQDCNHQFTERPVSDLFGGYTPSQEAIEKINWEQPEPSQPHDQSPTDPQNFLPTTQAFLDLSSKPTLREVDELVVARVAAEWQRLALRLGVEGCVIEIFSRNHPNDCEAACLHMLDRWLRGDRRTGEEERTWSTLLSALGRAGYTELESMLRRKHFRAEERL